MGGKPRSRPVQIKDLIHGFVRHRIGLEVWEVHRRLLPDHRSEEFKMGLKSLTFQRVTRGPSKGRKRMTLVVEYIDDFDHDYFKEL